MISFSPTARAAGYSIGMPYSTHRTNERPLVSIFVCTRNRAANVVPTVTSIQACGYASFELFVLDQSDNDATEAALSVVCSTDPRVTYVRLPRPGKPAALMEGLRRARGAYTLLTDDDCEVRTGWVDAHLTSFGYDASVGCVFGAVEAGPHDPLAGYVPDRKIEAPHTVTKLADLLTMPGWGNIGMGANMGIRTELVRYLGGWDTCIGPGTKFGSGDDTDFAVRTLRAGHAVHFTPQARVVHYGFRYWKSARSDYTRIAFGLGCIVAKHARCGALFPGGARPVYFYARQSLSRLTKAERPAGAVFVLGWCRGFLAGMRQSVDRHTNMFIPDVATDAYASHVANVVLRSEQAAAEDDRQAPT
jgi:glycosyltransferase involved in cell wall biosynthesis